MLVLASHLERRTADPDESLHFLEAEPSQYFCPSLVFLCSVVLSTRGHCSPTFLSSIFPRQRGIPHVNAHGRRPRILLSLHYFILVGAPVVCTGGVYVVGVPWWPSCTSVFDRFGVLVTQQSDVTSFSKSPCQTDKQTWLKSSHSGRKKFKKKKTQKLG